MEIFGLKIGSVKKDKQPPNKVVVPQSSDGAREVSHLGPVGGRFIDIYDGNVLPTEEISLIKKYREVAQCTEVDRAVSEIINDAITYDEAEIHPIKLEVDDASSGGTCISDKTKLKIATEFGEILTLMDFSMNGYDLFRSWYIDGRSFFNIVVDEGKKSEGISEIVHVDSLFIKKVREIEKDVNGIIKEVKEYFIYAPEHTYEDIGAVTNRTNLIRFESDAIVHITSGITDIQHKMVLSHLHKAMKPANQLGMIEDSIVVYRVTRAPERRVFYIDVGNLPKKPAEEYLNSVMNKYRNNVVYDTKDGTIKDNKNYMSMLEDFWLPRREGGRGTEITTLQGGENLGQLEDVSYFQKKLYDSLNVPSGRMESESLFTLAKDSEITREEVKFSKFINRLRLRFAKGVFNKMLKTQCMLKNITTEADWEEKIEPYLKYIFVEDSHFAELKKIQVLTDRLELVVMMQEGELTNKYFSKEYVRKNILLQTDEEIDELKSQREKEDKEEPDIDPDADPEQGGFGGDQDGGFGGGEDEESKESKGARVQQSIKGDKKDGKDDGKEDE